MVVQTAASSAGERMSVHAVGDEHAARAAEVELAGDIFSADNEHPHVGMILQHTAQSSLTRQMHKPHSYVQCKASTYSPAMAVIWTFIHGKQDKHKHAAVCRHYV